MIDISVMPYYRPKNIDKFTNVSVNCLPNKGELYTAVLTKCRNCIPPFYSSITDEINKRKFPTKTRRSYSHIPEYYTIPINRPYVDVGPAAGNPYGRWSQNTHPNWARSDQTPELLEERFEDNLTRSVSTMAEMVDMHSKHLPFEILKDIDVIYIYRRLKFFIGHNRMIDIPTEAQQYADFLNQIVDFLGELKRLYTRSCKRLRIEIRADNTINFMANLGVSI